MNSCALIIPTCRHTLPDGRRCQQPAVRLRACCRHHLDAQARFHNMARARRRTVIPRLRVPETSRDLAWNKIELNRLLATERIDPDAALMMLWAMDLTTETLRDESARRPRRAQKRASNPNEIYDVTLTPLFPQSLSETLSQMIGNTKRQGEGVRQSGELAPGLVSAAPRSMNRAERRRFAAISDRAQRKANSEKRNPSPRLRSQSSRTDPKTFLTPPLVDRGNRHHVRLSVNTLVI